MNVYNNDQLTEVATNVGKKYGYSEVTATFEKYERFKVSWSHVKYGWAEIKISDYLVGMSSESMSDLIDITFGRMNDLPHRRYSDRLNAELTSQEMREKQRPVFLSRNGYEREPFMEVNGMPVYWTMKNRGRLGHTAATLGVIVLDKRLKEASDDIIRTAAKVMYNDLRQSLMNLDCVIDKAEVSEKEASDLYDWMKWNGMMFKGDA